VLQVIQEISRIFNPYAETDKVFGETSSSSSCGINRGVSTSPKKMWGLGAAKQMKI